MSDQPERVVPAASHRDRQAALGNEIAAELRRAQAKFGPMASPHEGWAVIQEEVEELWAHVKANTGRSDEARIEAIQVAAMAARYAFDICEVGDD